MSNESIFINLKILAAVPPFARLNTCHELFQIEVDAPWSISWMWRLLRGDNRHEAVKRISALIDNARAIATSESQEATRMKAHVEKALQGIAHLRETYRNDFTVLASLERIADKMTFS